MRTPISIQSLLLSGDGTPATGTICLTPTTSAVNSDQLYGAEPICGLFDTKGRVVAQNYEALEVWASDDDGIDPVVAYVVSVRIDGQSLLEFTCTIPAASTAFDAGAVTADGTTTVNLSELVVSPSMVGQPITGGNIPISTTVVSVDVGQNALTMSNPATMSGTTIVAIGGAAALTGLLAAAL